MAVPAASEPQRLLPTEAPIGMISGQALHFATGRGRIVGKGRYGSVESYPPDARLTGSDREQLAVKYALDDARDGAVAPDAIRELRYLAGLRHPNVLRLVDYFIYPGATGIVTPLAQGSMAALASRFDLPLVKTLVRQLLLALDYVHAHGVVHADVKPDNVLVFADEHGALSRAALADFGLAHDDRCRDKGNLIADRGFTARYRAPECNLGMLSIPASDVWSAVVLAYEVATRHRLFKLEGLTAASPPSAHALASWQAQVKLLGKPTERTWPGVSALPRWREMTKGMHAPRRSPGGAAAAAAAAAGAGEWQAPQPIPAELRAFVSRALIMDFHHRATAAELSRDPWFGAEALAADGGERVGCDELLAESLRAPTLSEETRLGLEARRQAVGTIELLGARTAAAERTRHCATAVLDRVPVASGPNWWRSFGASNALVASVQLGVSAFFVAASMLEPRTPNVPQWFDAASQREVVRRVPAAALGETTAYDELYSLQVNYSSETQHRAFWVLRLLAYTSCGSRFDTLTRARLAVVLACLATGERCLERQRGATAEELEPCLVAMFDDLRALQDVHTKVEFLPLLGALGKVPLPLGPR